MMNIKTFEGVTGAARGFCRRCPGVGVGGPGARLRGASAATLSLLLVMWASSVGAQQINGETRGAINVQNFQPSANPFGVFVVEGARGLGHLQVAGGLVLNFAAEPLRALPEVDDGEGEAVVSDLLMADALFAIGFLDLVELGVGFPVVLNSGASVNGVEVSGASVGDLSLRPRFSLLDPEEAALGVAITAQIILPTGDGEAFVSEDTVTLRTGVALERELGAGVSVLFNLGAQMKDERSFGALSVSNELMYGAGLQWWLWGDRWMVGGELNGATALDDPFEESVSPLEGLLGVKWRPGPAWQLEAGAGRGLVGGYGAPSFRAFVGVRVAPFTKVPPLIVEQVGEVMTGIDHVPARRELTRIGPEAAEVLREIAASGPTVVGRGRALSSLEYFPTEETRQFLTAQIADEAAPTRLRRKAMLAMALAFGARDFDNGVCAQYPGDRGTLTLLMPFLEAPDEDLREGAVEAIALLNTPEATAALSASASQESVPYIKALMERGGARVFAANGCPDTDCDGVDDKVDACPGELEDDDGFEDEDGCPEPDNDRDGVDDADDDCPDEGGLAVLGGCPDNNFDGDGVGEGDRCPDKAEDVDGFEDEDGCPDLDNDKDGVPDATDKCPNKPETLNGVKDEDGCPDQGKVIVTEDLKILEQVFFDNGKATIKARSFPLLAAVAKVLKGQPEILQVEIQGHTDDQGAEGANLRLSASRAEAVRVHLIEKEGIDAARLVAKGYGESAPATPVEGLRGRQLRAAREQNRRVQFEVLKRFDPNTPVEAAPGPPEGGAAGQGQGKGTTETTPLGAPEGASEAPEEAP